MIKKICIAVFILVQFSFAQNYGSLRFTNYADGRQSAFSLTFDDGLLTHSENVGPILNQYGFKGTFYVLPPFLSESLPGIWRYGTWQGFQSLASEGHEIGSHTMNHDSLPTLPWGDINTEGTLLYELYQSKIIIEQRIPSAKCISLNYPYTLRNTTVDSAVSLFYENGRTLGQAANDSSLTGQEWYRLKAKVVVFSLPRDSVSDDLDELYTFLEWTQNAINNHKWGMIIIHDVVPFNQMQELIGQGIYEPISNEWLTSLCDFLWARSSDKEVWVETVGNITRYIKERDNSIYQVISSSSSLIEINVTNNLNNTIFNYPLSGHIKIPDSWDFVRSEQNGSVDTLTTIVTDSGRVVLTKVIPNNGILKLSPVTSTSVETENASVLDFQLFQNYPNPFNPSTKIKFTIPNVTLSGTLPTGRQVEGSRVQLKVYDILGNEVATLVDEYKPAGNYEVDFTVGLNFSSAIASGIYFYQLKTGNFISTKKMLLLK
ncbi:MAG TPA: polysaccharide deacetylase family protein [Ignavibacteriaceae bacterium]|nr:polysaccharide deacetylase family protein [Ignavibacteriaceae bacterium]